MLIRRLRTYAEAAPRIESGGGAAGAPGAIVTDVGVPSLWPDFAVVTAPGIATATTTTTSPSSDQPSPSSPQQSETTATLRADG